MVRGLKRKFEESRLSPERPADKKTRPPSPISLLWAGSDSERHVLTPFAPFIPSPLAKDKYEPDSTLDEALRLYGPAVQKYFREWNRLDTRSIREDIRNACDSRHLVWADPYEPFYLKSADGLRLCEPDGTCRMIRFHRTTRGSAFFWFAYVEPGLNLRINGMDFNRPQGVYVGPISSYSIVEYGDRAVFLYLDRSGVDYTPLPTLNKHAPHKLTKFGSSLALTGREVKGSGFWGKDKGKETGQPRAGGSKNSNRKSPKKGQDGDEARKDEEKERISGGSPDLKPEMLPDDAKPCEYFDTRMKEWRKLREKSGIVVQHPIPEARKDSWGGFTGQWLEDRHIFRAIASITTAIEIENDVPFAQLTDILAQRIRHGPLLDVAGLDKDFFGPKQELFLPWNTNVTAGGAHWILVRVRLVSNEPEIIYYDSLEKQRDRSGRGLFRNAIKNLLWFDENQIDQQPSYDRVLPGLAARQNNNWACGYLTILNAWCLALGLQLNPKFEGFLNKLNDFIDMVNLAMAGLMDSATILAFVRCVKFVVPGPMETVAHIAPDRHFSRTAPFLSEASLVNYIRERRRIEQRPNLPRIRPEVIRHILQYGGFTTYDEEDMVMNLELYYNTWLKLANVVDPTSPLSPASPATMRLALEKAIQGGMVVPNPLPMNPRELRQIFDIYHALLKSDGMMALNDAREERAAAKAEEAAADHTAMDIDEPLGSPLYRNPAITALSRLSMLPPRVSLTPEELAEVRTKKKRLVLKLLRKKP